MELEENCYSIRFAPVGGGGAQQSYEIDGPEKLMDVLSNLKVPAKQARQAPAELEAGDASIAVTGIPEEPLRHYGLI